MQRVADYIINRLVSEKIKKIFMVTGRGILYLTDAVAKNQDIEGVSFYHEQGAAYAAMAYASSEEGMSACLISTGCAAANAVTAALCAWQDNLPCIFLSGQHMLHETTRYTKLPIRTYGSQETDIISIIDPITKYAVMLTDPDEVAAAMDQAVYFANTCRKGPVWIDVPLDVQNLRIEQDELKRWLPSSFPPREILHDVQRTAEELQVAKRPLLYIGGGMRSACARQLIYEFVEKYRIPVVFSPSAADVYGTGNELSIGAVGSIGGSRSGNFAVQNADYLLVLASKLCSQTIGTEPEKFARDAKVTVVDIDEWEHLKQGIRIDRLIIADASRFLQVLGTCPLQIHCEEWVQKCLHWKDVFAVSKEAFIKQKTGSSLDLYHFADSLSDLLAENATIVTDAGLEELIVPSTIRFHGEQRCIFPASQGAMGYAIPAAVGAYYAGRENIVVVVGDGSFMMNMQELQVIAWHEIPVKIFVINNNLYAIIRKRQHDLFRNRTIGNDPSDGLGAPNFQKIAISFSIPYVKIQGEERLCSTIRDILAMDTPCICEVMCRQEQPYLHTSISFDEKRRLVKRSLEDLSPFLDREQFLSEMITMPIIQ